MQLVQIAFLMHRICLFLLVLDDVDQIVAESDPGRNSFVMLLSVCRALI